MRALAAALLAWLPISAQDVDPVEVLMRLRDQVLEHGDRIPNRTCVETVTRERYVADATPVPKTCDGILARRKTANLSQIIRLDATDRLRLDVAFAGDREIYSWAGARRFEEGEIDQLIPDGSIGTGPFASMLLGLFSRRIPRFAYEGETMRDGQTIFEYTFRVPVSDSGYRVKAGWNWIFTGYTGTLLVNANTAELIRMVVRTDELPHETNTCETETTLDYGTVQIGASGYLLPVKSRMRFIGQEGGEWENSIAFSACREYRGEAKLVFGAAEAPPPAAERSVAPVALPVRAPVSIVLDTPIDSTISAAGDRIQGHLDRPIADSLGRAVVPTGAAIEGRLMRVETRHGRDPSVLISLRWETIDVNGSPVPLSLLPVRKFPDQNMKIGDRILGLRQRGVEIELPPASDRLYGVYRFPKEQVVVERGFRTEWTTGR